VLASGHFILGENVSALETEVAAYLGVKSAVGLASGTDALVVALRVLDIGPGDEVIVPAYTFFATAGTVLSVGATPVFVDVDPRTFCLDVSQVEERITSRTRAIIPVHLYGHPVDMKPLLELAQTRGLKVIEDNAQAFGASYAGRKTGSLGDIGCLSFFPSKNLGAYGDGGMLVTDDEELAARARRLRAHGWDVKYFPLELGYNSRLDALQAAILRVKLPHVDEWNASRGRLAANYCRRLSGLELGLPVEIPPAKHVYHLFVLRLEERDRVQGRLRAAGIASGVYYPQPLHLAEPCRFLRYAEGSFPVSERLSRQTLAIPLYPEMTSAQFESVVAALQAAP
jgi:dTDP-4-amino-4,6-dideoxygalactose transaminase